MPISRRAFCDGQAIRRRVNHEADRLEALMTQIPSLLEPNGRAALLSFHPLDSAIITGAFTAPVRVLGCVMCVVLCWVVCVGLCDVCCVVLGAYRVSGCAGGHGQCWPGCASLKCRHACLAAVPVSREVWPL